MFADNRTPRVTRMRSLSWPLWRLYRGSSTRSQSAWPSYPLSLPARLCYRHTLFSLCLLFAILLPSSLCCPQRCTCTTELATSGGHQAVPIQFHHRTEEQADNLNSSGHQHRPHHRHANLARNFALLSINCTQRGLDTVVGLLENVTEVYGHKKISLGKLCPGQRASHATKDTLFPMLQPEYLNQNRLDRLDRGGLSSSIITYLDVSLNELTFLENNTFDALPALQVLILSSNRLTRIETHAFAGLRSLLVLDLSGNSLHTFPALSSAMLPSLQEVNLRQNQIEWIPARAFNSLSHRSSMAENNLDGADRMTEVPVAPAVLTDETPPSKVVKFDLASNPLVRVHVQAFVNMKHLRKLHLSEVSNQTVLPFLWNCTSLEFIRFDRSRLKTIDSRVCVHIGRTLKSLVLKSNRLTSLPPLDGCTELRVLDVSYNALHRLSSEQFSGQSKLIDLVLNHNQLHTIEHRTFHGLERLKVLNLDSNDIEHIHPEAFVPLRSLHDLNLAHNKFATLPTAGLGNISDLKVHGNRNLAHFPSPDAFPHVHTLALSYAYHCCAYVDRPLTPLGGAQDVSKMYDSILWFEDVNNINLTVIELMSQFWKEHADSMEDLSETEIKLLAAQYGIGPVDAPGHEPASLDGALWSMLEAQQPKQSKVYLQANYLDKADAHHVRCLPRPGPFQPCKDLFDWWTLRFGVWLIFPLAMIGNATVLTVLLFGRRRRRRRKMDVTRFLVCNLAAADFCMGVYLGMLALVDASTLGNFRAYAIRWQYSWSCRITGVLGVFSTELSVYTLAVITLERNYAITNAMHLNKRLSLRAATTIMSIGWMFAFVMALLPLFGVSDYRKFAICLPFETDDSIWSLLYVLSLISVNGIAFLLLMGCYLRMYCAIRGSQAWNSNDTRIAMRMAILVFTDFLCWAPIAFFAVTAVAGCHLISLEQAKIFAVFVLPLNACANPFLYAFFTKQFKKECQTLVRRMDTLRWLQRHLPGFRSPRETEPPAGVPVMLHRSAPVRATSIDNCKLCGHPLSEGATPLIEEPLLPLEAGDAEWNGKFASQKKEEDRHAIAETKIVKCPQCDCTKHAAEDLKHSSTADTISASNGMWRSTMKQLFGTLSNRSLINIDNRQAKPACKQFKSNSIIYQSNYRKNHIHMTLENEIRPFKPTTSKAKQTTGRMTHYNSDNVIIPSRQPRALAKLNSMPLGTLDDQKRRKLRPESSASVSHLASKLDVSDDKVRPKSRISSSSLSSKQETSSGGLDKCEEAETTLVEVNVNNSSVEYTAEQIEYDVSHAKPSTSAMASGIMMLKRKFIRKSNARRLSTDSQYEFSSGRKDSSTSTSGGRLSFSSETFTKSTSSSFYSSGVYSASSGSNANNDAPVMLPARTEYCMVMNNWQYRRLLASTLDTNRDWCERHLQSTKQPTSAGNNHNTIGLSLSRQELCALLRDKHGETVKTKSAVTIKIVDQDDGEEGEDEDEDEDEIDHPEEIQLQQLKAASEVDKLDVLYLLSCLSSTIDLQNDKMAETSFNETSSASSSTRSSTALHIDTSFDQLEVYLLDEETSHVQNDEDNSEVSLCSDCTKHYLINKLIEHLINKAKDDSHPLDLSNLRPRALLLRCSIRLANGGRVHSDVDVIDESDELQAPAQSHPKCDEFMPRLRAAKSFKLKSTSHEKIRHFFLNFLPRSSKSKTNKMNHKLLTVVDAKQIAAPGSLATRRSSSAFAIGELLYATDGQAKLIACRDFCTKSCSQLQIVSNHSSRTSSIQDARPRSVLSDVFPPNVCPDLPQLLQHNSISSFYKDCHHADSQSCKAAL